MVILRIVSGGQTGADQGGWDAAIYCDLPYGGWVPHGRKTEAGAIPTRYQGYQEHASPDYVVRTEANVVDSDATVVFSYGRPTGGSLRTVEFARKHGRPYLHVDLKVMSRRAAVDTIVAWLENRDGADYEDYSAIIPEGCVLNVAGSRESKSPGIQSAVCARMVDVISKVNGKLFYPLPDVAKPSGTGWEAPET